MNTNLLAIDNMFASTIGAVPAPAKPAAVKKSKQSSPTSLDNTPFTNARGTITTDNTLVEPHKRLNKEPRRQFSRTLRKEITAKVPQKANGSRNTEKQKPSSCPAAQPSIVQLWLAQYSLNAKHGKEGVARKVGPKAGYELAQLLANARPDRSPSGAGKTARPHKNEPVLIIDQKQIGLKAASPNTSKRPLITDTLSTDTPSTDTPSNEGKNANRIQMPNTRPLAARGLTNQQSGKGLTLKALVDAHTRIATVSEKPAIVPALNASGSQKTPPLAGKELTPEVLADADGKTSTASEKPAIAGKPVVPGGQKVPAPNPSSPPVQDKSSGLQSQLAGIGPGKSPLIAEKAVNNEAAAGQPSRDGTPRLSEPPADDGIEQGDNSPGNPAPQKLHHAQLRVSTGQTKDRGSSASNNNSNSGFEQVLSDNNAATSIAEQTSAFPEAAKTDNLPVQTSPSEVSASITEKILESIYSSSSQQAGTQQISIRLHPPELGKVFVKFEQQEGQITGLLEVSRAQTRYEVERALPHIIQNLADCGIQIKRLEVMLTDQSEQQSYRDQSLQDGLFQQHPDFPEGGNPDNPGAIGADEPGIGGNDSSYQDSLEPQMQITANSINVLI